MHQQHIGDVAAVKLYRQVVIIGQAGVGRRQERGFHRGDGRVVAAGDAARIGVVPLIVVEAHRHRRDAVAGAGEEGARRQVLGQRVALGEIGIAQPVPILARHQRRDGGLALRRVGAPFRQRVGVQVHVRIGVVAQREAGRAPQREYRRRRRIVDQPEAVHETVDRRGVRVLERGDDRVRDLHARGVGGERGMRGQVVEGDRDLHLRRGRRGEQGQSGSEQQFSHLYFPRCIGRWAACAAVRGAANKASGIRSAIA